MPRHSTSLRDAALRRLQRLNRWLIAGSVALTAGFAEVAANAFPGKTLKTTGASKAGTSSASPKTSTEAVKPPVQAPTATPEGQASSEEPSSSSESAPSEESAPEESTPSQESPEQESVPPAGESAPAQETAPTPAPEEAPPVVSGGS